MNSLKDSILDKKTLDENVTVIDDISVDCSVDVNEAIFEGLELEGKLLKVR